MKIYEISQKMYKKFIIQHLLQHLKNIISY